MCFTHSGDRCWANVMTHIIRNYIGRELNTTLKNYCRDTSGNFAVTWALAALPLMLSISIAVDLLNINRVQVDLQTAVDNAALTAVMPMQYTDNERALFAEDVFYDNLAGREKFEPKAVANATREEVSIVASATVPTLLGGMIGHTENNIKVSATANLSTADVVCVLALDPSGENAITFEDSAVFNAPACSVQANSTHPKAIVSKSAFDPLAKSFCSSGGSVGDFEPYIRNECSLIEDPYSYLTIPKAGRSCDDVGQISLREDRGRWRREAELPKDGSGRSIIPDGAVLKPGIYCKGLVIDGISVEFEPGIYHVWGDLHFTNNAQAEGDSVTFIIKGTKNRLLIDNGAEVSLRAPSTGATAGLVFWQKYLDFIPYVFGRVPDSPDAVIATSEIASGGGLNLIGTAYLPDHELIISSENRVASKSPAMSLIARRVRFTEKANMLVRVDHEEGGVPPIQPRSDAGARLVD